VEERKIQNKKGAFEMSRKCGSGWSEWIVPDFPFWLWFLSIKKCCIFHDMAYEFGGTEANRLTADLNLHDCIINKGRASWFWRFRTYRYRVDKTADMYLYGVREYGAKHFEFGGNNVELD